MTPKQKRYFYNKYKRINNDFLLDLHSIINRYEYESKMDLIKFKLKLLSI